MSSAQVLPLCQASEVKVERCGFDYTSLTVAQEEVYEFDGPAALWRDGNQLGKSLELAYWCHSLINQCHPTIRRRSPVRILVISYSIEQMIPLMEKLWNMSRKHVPGQTWKRGQPPRLLPKCGFEQGRGVTGQPPRLVFTDGSEIVFATYRQGQARIAGGTFDSCVMDEPPTEAVFGEVLPRLLRKRGLLRVTFTPVPDMPDMTWLWEKVDSPTDPLIEFNFGLCEDILLPKGWPKPWLLQEDIAAYSASLLEVERAMRIDGAREPLVTGRWLKSFDEAKHVIDVDMSKLRGWYLVGSWDHGTVDGKQVFSIQAYQDRQSDRPKAVIVDEAINEGITTPEHDAEDALAALARNGLEYDDIDVWVGDVPTGSQRWEVRKSNAILRKELARQLKRQVRTLKPIHQPRKHAGSLTYGMRLVNTLFDRDDLHVSRRCVGFIQGAKTFAGDTKDPFKDPLDAPRYGIERACTGRVLASLSARY